MSLLDVKNLKTWFPISHGLMSKTVAHVKAVDDVSFAIGHNEVLGLVGESGCGKSTIGRSILRSVEPTAGSVHFEGSNLIDLSGEKLRNMRRNMQIIFQDPASSLNPRMSVGASITEPLSIHKTIPKKEWDHRVAELLAKVGLPQSARYRFPHEFSGGQCQRIGIARALALNPKLIIADEPVSALDVSIQSQVINLMLELKAEFGLSYLFISHDLSVVRYISDRIAVMYLGKIVEMGTAEEVYANPLHPYTKALISAVPSLDRTKARSRIILTGDIPSPANPPSGCTFHTRCPEVRPECHENIPELRDVSGRWVRCPFAG